jgi:hypothetical protein
MFKSPVIATLFAVSGTAAGSLVTEHTIDLQTLGAVAAVVLPATWYLSNRYTKIEDRLDELEEKLNTMPCTQARTILVKPEVKLVPCTQAEIEEPKS